MKIPAILVTGASGQLGSELQELSQWMQHRFIFAGRDVFPLDDFSRMRRFFEENELDYCVNCAAYTAVDRAETERENAYKINAEGVGVLAALCSEFDVKLIHISTDYVYDGTAGKPLLESDDLKPLNVYGESKLKGEELALQNKDTIVIRTSWVYSAYGNNFVKTMLRLFAAKDEISVVSDQVGSPTYAADLALAILLMIEKMDKGRDIHGIFNFSNSGITNWFEFANEIKSLAGATCTINAIATSEYKTPAQRPLYSVMDTGEISKLLDWEIPDWKQSLRVMMQKLYSF